MPDQPVPPPGAASPGTAPGWMQEYAGFAGDRPNVARMYDYWLGGKDNTEADRAAADDLTDRVPHMPLLARRNRDFLIRAVRHLAAEHGIGQFLDIGSGLPTRSNVHQVARQADPGSRVVYVDHDPVVTSHARALLAGQEGVGVLCYDVRDTARLLADPLLGQILDLDRPVAVLMVALLHFVDGGPQELQAQIFDPLARALPPGSCLVLSHGVAELPGSSGAASVARDTYLSGSSGVGPVRSPQQVRRLLPRRWLLAEPGLVDVEGWRGIGVPSARPPADPSLWVAAGVARLQPQN